MTDFRQKIDSLFVEKLGYEFVGEALPVPNTAGADNIISIAKEYSGGGVDVVVVECRDRIPEFQKRLIKDQKTFFPNSHFLFVSNGGMVFDIYNISTSKKLKPISYNEIERNTSLFSEKIQLFNIDQSKDAVDLRIKIEKAFETNDKVTKKFFDKFKALHKKLQSAIGGIDHAPDVEWYASVLMNRLMFIYFLQKHGVIQNNTDFMLQKFDQTRFTGKDFYRDFLLPLFFIGFAKRNGHALKQAFTAEFGEVPYLNGGLFYPHQIETKYTPAPAQKNELKAFDDPNYIRANTLIRVNAEILHEVLTFLNGYTWYLDNRPMKEDTDINPDVLGYIFEKYINQKELGAYYTKEDITEYIAKNTIIPFIFDKLRANGFAAPDPSPMITANEDIIGNMADYIEQTDDYETLKFLYRNILCELSVLDPSVGSGAFLFAALNVLLPVYRKTVFKLQAFAPRQPNDAWLQNLCKTLAAHSQEYYLTKQIILNNLYGVDIVKEATEICKLRLFLQLVSNLADIKAIEPLPDIDFNIYAGNSLVGGTSWTDLQNNYTMDIFTSANRESIKANIGALSVMKQEYKLVNEQIAQLAALKTEYKNLQHAEQGEERLSHLKFQIQFIEKEIGSQLNVGIENPFHWFVEFDTIMQKGGFDVIIGNPPYVEYAKVRKAYEIKSYETEKCGNIYANFIERSFNVLVENGKFAMIVPISSISTNRMAILQNYLIKKSKNLWYSNFSERPSKLFEGADVSLTIIVGENSTKNENIYTTKYNKWKTQDRTSLFDSINYVNSKLFKSQISIPKIGNQLDVEILGKMKIQKKKISDFMVSNSDFGICYRNAGGRYYKIILNFEPDFYVNQQKVQSSTYHFLYFKNEKTRDAICALMNSSLFYYFWLAYSDTWHMTGSDILPFPVPESEILFDSLSEINSRLMLDFKLHSQQKIEKRNDGKDEIMLSRFSAKKSKSIIDEIDTVLGQSFNFNENELNYILNYDIEFRTDDE